MKFILGSIFFIAAMLYSGWAAASTLKVEVQANPVVATERISLGDIAKISGEDKEVEKAMSIFVMNLPAGVLSKSINKEMIAGILKKNRFKTDEMEFTAPEEVKISRKTMKVEAASLEEMARAHLEKGLKEKGGDVIIKSLTLEGGDLSLPEGKLDVEFLPLNRSPLAGNLFLHANLMVDGRLTERIEVKAEVETSTEAPLASRNIKKGEILTEDDFHMGKVEARKENSLSPADAKDIIGKRASKSIQENQPILENMIDVPPLVNKKDRVKIVFESKFLTISAVGVAQESGPQGSYIKVMNLDSEKTIVAKVIGENLVKVEF
ncbi:MAG: flagellar basal body P-ring formation protein FlgA [Nitrospinae bacterium]|nr:flagellar basal body P-ring formation protein FlgA [Nitrospinota bacterium]